MLLSCPHGAVLHFEEINVDRLGLHSLLLSRNSLYLLESIKPNILALNDNQNIQGRQLFPLLQWCSCPPSYFPCVMEMDGERLYIIIAGENRSGCQQGKCSCMLSTLSIQDCRLIIRLSYEHRIPILPPPQYTNQVEIRNTAVLLILNIAFVLL